MIINKGAESKRPRPLRYIQPMESKYDFPSSLRYRNMRKLIYLMFLIALAAGCSGKQKEDTARTSQQDSVELLEMPQIPSEITDPNQRADYLAVHFWDNMDFRDTLRSHNKEFIEQNFVNYTSILPYASDTLKVIDGFSAMLKKAEVDRKAYDLLMKTADSYLYDPNSPMLNEDLYILYLRSVMQSDYLSSDEKVSPAYRLEQVSKNRPGMKAADFKFRTTDGKESTLMRSLPDHNLLLIFFDPECENCERIIGKLQEDPVLADNVASGNISVLAVYPGEKEESWRKKASTMPKTWTIGINDDIEDKELYYLPAMPIIYEIDKTGTVIQKDIQL